MPATTKTDAIPRVARDGIRHSCGVIKEDGGATVILIASVLLRVIGTGLSWVWSALVTGNRTLIRTISAITS
ncbi:hypothetical protein [Mycetocola zhadangensis]|nr:hypothetical protein [Mycetocola zhadangensis]